MYGAVMLTSILSPAANAFDDNLIFSSALVSDFSSLFSLPATKYSMFANMRSAESRIWTKYVPAFAVSNAIALPSVAMSNAFWAITLSRVTVWYL